MASLLEKKNGSATTDNGIQDEQQLELNGAGSRKRLHDSASAFLETKEQTQSSKNKHATEGKQEIFFRLFKFPKGGEHYLLEIHQVKTGHIARLHLLVYEENRRWKVRVCKLKHGYHVVFPILHDPSPLIFHKKYDFSLQERLNGWTVGTRTCGNGKEDKFYCHGGRQFRSFTEIATFIVYSSQLNDLEIISSNRTSQEILEIKEAMMIISSSEVPCNSSNELTDDSSEKALPESNEKQPDDKSFSSTEQQTEADEIDYEFLHYIYVVFDYEDPPSIDEILGEPKPYKLLV